MIWIEDIAQAFEDLDANWQAYVNKETGEILFVPLTQELMDGFSQDDKELFSMIKDLDNFIALPSQKELREFDIMEQYTEDTYNIGMKKRLLFALNHSKPFRNFRAQLRLLNLEEDYQHYRYMVFCAKARSWCKEHDIVYEVEDEEVISYFKELENDEEIVQNLEDFNDEFDEFEYNDEYEDYFE